MSPITVIIQVLLEDILVLSSLKNLLQRFHCLFILMLLCVMLVCFAHDLCLVTIYTMFFVAMAHLWYVDTQFVYFNHCFPLCTVLVNQLVFLMLCLCCSLCKGDVLSEDNNENNHYYYTYYC